MDEGLLDNEKTSKTIRIKKSILASDFYNKSCVYKNKAILNKNEDKLNLSDYSVKTSFTEDLPTHLMKEDSLFSGKEDFQHEVEANTTAQIESLGEFEKLIVLKAFNQNKDFWNFKNIQTYLPHLTSMDDLLNDKNLGGHQITIKSSESRLSRLFPKDYLTIIGKHLREIAETIKKNTAPKKGTTLFTPVPMNAIFKEEKKIFFQEGNRHFEEINIDSLKETFIHDSLFGTSEEKSFIEFFEEKLLDELKKQYEEVRLVRNNQELKIYQFDNGKGFAPDFLLFLKTNENKSFYQIFIEPKGAHLIEFEKEKEIFLKDIEKKCKIEIDEQLTFEKRNEERDIKLIGLGFYNGERQNSFYDDFSEQIFSH